MMKVMEDTPAQLVEPDESWRDEFVAYCEEFRDANEPVAHGQLADATEDFAGLVRRWVNHAEGAGLRDGLTDASV
jgi:hypothetical protein